MIEVSGEMLGTDGAPRIDPGCPHDVLELANIAGPRVRAQHRRGRPAESLVRKLVPQEPTRQVHHIATPLS